MFSKNMVDSFVGSSVMVEFRSGCFVETCLGLLERSKPGRYCVHCPDGSFEEFSLRDLIGLSFSPSFSGKGGVVL